ncbi:MAG TPA: G1 family glutamic endopeptidase [Streptosporangiaceae bacterium]|nr:G1 family glutamic endopeptidase [Streptosporangiaceae bacterium]
MPNLARAAATSVAVLTLALGAGAPGAAEPSQHAPLDTPPHAPAGGSAGVSAGGSAGGSAGVPRPLEFAARPAIGSVDSLNSAGYAASRPHARFASIRATFFVPYLNCGLSKGAYSSQWVGLDGFEGKPDSVEQDGIEADCSAAGRSSFHAWYAMYPRRRAMPALAIRSGDSVTASVSYDLADARFALALTDNTTGGHFRVHASCPRGLRCPRNSAEVISSTPATRTAGHLAIAPLADYGAVSFSGISITDRAGHRGGLRSAHWAATRIIQTRPAAPFELMARPTPIEADAFDNYWSRER